MGTIGGILTFIAVYGFYLIMFLSFFFNPNIITFGFLCLAVYIFTRRNNDKEKK